MRESCRSIEELDLGGNKLNDLIEVYKILQCTPNLRFLNLSENDLSRSAPVAMASTNLTSAATTSQSGFLPCSSYSTSPSQQTTNWPMSSPLTPEQRSCLAPLNQNTSHSLGARRHSSLGQSPASKGVTPGVSGQSTSTLRARQEISRVAEARRIAAANALAQSKKTSSSVASKLAHSHQTGAQINPSRLPTSQSKMTLMGAQQGPAQRGKNGPTSTMNLARSLSSLSAKDLRASGTSHGRLASHHRGSAIRDARHSNSASSMRHRPLQQQDDKLAGHDKASGALIHSLATTAQEDDGPNIGSDSGHQNLFVEPIAESEADDVDMNSEQQASALVGGGNQADAGRSASQMSGSNNNSNNNQSPQQMNLTTQMTSGVSSKPAAYHHGYSAQPRPLVGGHCNNNISSTNTASAPTYTSTTNSFRRTFNSIKALALNNTGCQWKVVCSILSRMPYLEELHLSLNNYEKIDLEPNEFKHHCLKRLYLCNNPKLTNWQELNKLLIAFPSLEALSIANCNISQIPDNLDRAREWRKICGLNIDGWPIKEWPVVERLNQLPSLIDLKCRNLEVLNTIDEPRHHLIARLPKLQRLNGSEIEEREDAEKAFIRFFMANSHLERPSRFHELMQIYGEISTVDVNVDLSPPSHAQVRVIYLDRSHYRKENNDDIMMSEDFLLKLMDYGDNGNVENNDVATEQSGTGDDAQHESGMELETSTTSSSETSKPVRLFKDEGQEIIALNVDLRQSVRKFKSNLANLFGLNSQNLILYYIDHEMVGLMGPELLKYSQKKLWNYNVQDGDQFIVEER